MSHYCSYSSSLVFDSTEEEAAYHELVQLMKSQPRLMTPTTTQNAANNSHQDVGCHPLSPSQLDRLWQLCHLYPRFLLLPFGGGRRDWYILEFLIRCGSSLETLQNFFQEFTPLHKYASLRHHQHDHNNKYPLHVACDMPHTPPGVIRYLVHQFPHAARVPHPILLPIHTLIRQSPNPKTVNLWDVQALYEASADGLADELARNFLTGHVLLLQWAFENCDLRQDVLEYLAMQCLADTGHAVTLSCRVLSNHQTRALATCCNTLGLKQLTLSMPKCRFIDVSGWKHLVQAMASPTSTLEELELHLVWDRSSLRSKASKSMSTLSWPQQTNGESTMVRNLLQPLRDGLTNTNNPPPCWKRFKLSGGITPWNNTMAKIIHKDNTDPNHSSNQHSQQQQQRKDNDNRPMLVTQSIVALLQRSYAIRTIEISHFDGLDYPAILQALHYTTTLQAITLPVSSFHPQDQLETCLAQALQVNTSLVQIQGLLRWNTKLLQRRRQQQPTPKKSSNSASSSSTTTPSTESDKEEDYIKMIHYRLSLNLLGRRLAHNEQASRNDFVTMLVKAMKTLKQQGGRFRQTTFGSMRQKQSSAAVLGGETDPVVYLYGLLRECPSIWSVPSSSGGKSLTTVLNQSCAVAGAPDCPQRAIATSAVQVAPRENWRCDCP